MFDIGALELVLVAVVALLVVGPERLPRLARTAGLWVRRARHALGAVRDEIDRELKAEELKEILRKQSESNPLETILEMDPKPSRPNKPKPAPEAGDRHDDGATSADSGPKPG